MMMIIRHIFFSLLICLSGTILFPTAISAQQTVGSWESVASYGGIPKRIIDTPDRVYVLSQSNLSSYDKESGEILAYGQSNYLNDGKIADIYYNFDGKYLMISYENDNIDILTADGQTINFAELMNSTLTVSKTINDVAFNGDRIYVATDFGLMVLNVKKGIVEETGIYGFPINSVTTTSDRIFIGIRTTNTGTWSAPISGSHTRFNVFTRCWTDFVRSMESISDTKILGVGNSVGLLTYDPASDRLSWKAIRSGMGNTRIQRTRQGMMVHDAAPTFALFITPDDITGTEVALPAELLNNAISSYDADQASIWAANESGYGLFDAGSDKFKQQRMRPSGISGPNVGRIHSGSDGSIYFMTAGEANDNVLAYRSNVFINRLDPDGNYSDLTPTPNITYGYKFAIDPENGDLLSLAARTGIYRLDTSDGSHTLYNSSNSSVTPGIVPMMTDTKFDAKGNVWYLMHWDEDGADNLYVIPRAAWEKGPEGSEIIALDFGTQKTCHSSSLLIHSSGLVLFSGSFVIGAYDYGSTPQNKADDKYVISIQNNDEDGMSISGNYVLDMEEDHTGQVWLATSGGVRVIRDPKKMFESGWVIARPKVARNDGTNLADFLLDNETVTDVAVDANNHKWFATFGSGIYHTNAEGNEILEHFTTSNSGLISDMVYAVYPDPYSNKIYVGTDIGLCIYNSTSAPAAQSYSDVYAYPNPVTPDFTGLITITGLMDKSLVKISDSAGNVFHQTVSDGGMVVWDGCDSSGSRVKSGVYYVFASQNSDGSSAVVTKILIIN